MKNLLVPFLLAGVMAPALAAAPSVPDAAQLKKMTQRYAPVQLTADASKLSAGDRKAIAATGNTITGKVISEEHVHPDGYEEHIIRWVD